MVKSYANKNTSVRKQQCSYNTIFWRKGSNIGRSSNPERCMKNFSVLIDMKVLVTVTTSNYYKAKSFAHHIHNYMSHLLPP